MKRSKYRAWKCRMGVHRDRHTGFWRNTWQCRDCRRERPNMPIACEWDRHIFFLDPEKGPMVLGVSNDELYVFE